VRSPFIEPLIDRHFSNRKQALLWLFLGAHDWCHGYTIAPQTPSQKAFNLRCWGNSHAPEKLYLETTLGSLLEKKDDGF